ncbi:hypothetical protein [Microvirgula sp. AG722]|uniref:hypothetical protein n=1 Tax=Microvirgula sp. AG722 TaxID=2183901 RepID=UPI0011BDF26C|nr:hypothetical protein [Microvirgula sp. AG722]
MAGSALTQGASSVLGIGHFNLTAVAAAGAGAVLGHSIGKGLHAAGLRQPLLSGTLNSMASGGTQSLLHGLRSNRGRIAAKPFDNLAVRVSAAAQSNGGEMAAALSCPTELARRPALRRMPADSRDVMTQQNLLRLNG